MKIEQIATDKLIPYARNAKRHDDGQIAAIAASLREFGFCNPVLIDEGNGIIAGHGRVLAARKLDMDRVPCVRLSHLSDTQRRAYVLADNRLAEIGGGWDAEMLALEVESLRMDDFDLDLTGWDQGSLLEILNNTGASSDEGVPPDGFQEVDETIDTDHRCPSCGYEWSGGG